MRPKKIILCVDQNESTLSIRKFMLETRGYRVLTATSLDAALPIWASALIDLVIAELGSPIQTGNEVLEHFRGVDADVATILTSQYMRSGSIAHCADLFCGSECTPTIFVDRVRQLTTRRRGSRKKPVARVHFVEAEEIRGLA